MILEEDFKNSIKNFIQQKNNNYEVINFELTDDVNFIGEGYVDSIIFIELISFVDKTFGFEIDMAKMEPNDLMNFGSFIKSLLRQGA
ncbi:MAG: acyl carrier protein [Nitrospirae bacterium]|nr:acyl carrier protein [Nitrospirota bacterium]